MNVQVVGIVASVLSATSMLPQLIKILKEKDASSVSMLMVSVLIAALGAWIYYGVLIEDPIIIISNAFSVTVNFILLFAAFHFKKQ